MSKEKNSKKTTTKIGWFVIANVLVLFFLVLAFGREYVGSSQIKHEINQLEKERATLETEQLNTLQLIQDLSSEYYLETEARTKHGLGEEGETLIVVQEVDKTSDSALADDKLKISPNVVKWFYYFFDKTAYAQFAEL